MATKRTPPLAVANRKVRGPAARLFRSALPAFAVISSLSLLLAFEASGSAYAVRAVGSSARPEARVLAAQSPGVTPKTVTVGQIDDLTLPIDGLFKGAEDGTRAYFDYVNSRGGVNGRKIVFDARDSQYQGGVVATDTASIIKSDFAMVGGFSLLDSAELPLIDLDHMPDIAYPLAVSLADSPYVYSPDPNSVNDSPLGFMKFLKKKDPKAIRHVGILWANATPSTSQYELAFERALRSQGFDILYDRGYSDTEFSFLSDVLTMKAKGVQLFYSMEMPDFDAATLAKEMQQQNFRPMVIQVAAYSGALLTDAGGAANGMYIEQSYPLYLPGEDAKNVPAVALFDPGEAGRFEPERARDRYGRMTASSSRRPNAGSPPTRAGLFAALDKITSFDAGGMISPSDPAKNIPSSCFVLAQVRGSNFVRVPPTPKTGFVCSPGGMLTSGGLKGEVRPAPTS